MKFIKVERNAKNYGMSNLHAHPYYEIYYLLEGKRSFFLSNKMYSLEGPVIVIIPPYVMHRTDGGEYRRINVCVTPSYLNAYQEKVLRSKSLDVMIPGVREAEEFVRLLDGIIGMEESAHKGEMINTLFSYYVFLIDKMSSAKVMPVVSASDKKQSLLTFKVIAYLNAHYREKLTLDGLAEKFFISKSALNYNFKKAVSSTPMDFLLTIRLTAAKKLLIETKKSISQISEECGFSSPNYFCLIFKKRELVSPVTYRHMGAWEKKNPEA